MRRFWATLFTGCLASPVLAADPSGDWMVTDKTAVIRIAPCASKSGGTSAPSAFCGAILWTSESPGTDQNNPDPAKRGRSMIGLPIILDMKPSANSREWEGEIYNAKNGRIYSGSIALTSESVLRVKGCVLGLLCGGQDWSRALCQEKKASASPGSRSQEAPAQRSPLITSCTKEPASQGAPPI